MPRVRIHPPGREAKARAASRRQRGDGDHRLGSAVDDGEGGCWGGGVGCRREGVPNNCPNCGAARYAFEKEISLSKAWEIAAEAGRKSATLFGESAAHTAGRTKAVLEELAQDEQGQAVQADRQLAELRT